MCGHVSICPKAADCISDKLTGNCPLHLQVNGKVSKWGTLHCDAAVGGASVQWIGIGSPSWMGMWLMDIIIVNLWV
jgi:hypothetical protein